MKRCSASLSSVQFSRSVLYDSLRPHDLQHARQASLSITNSRSLLKLMSIGSVMSSNHLILCHPLLLRPSIFPSIRVFQMVQFFASGCQSIEVSASASVLPVSIQGRFPLGLTGCATSVKTAVFTVSPVPCPGQSRRQELLLLPMPVTNKE